MSDSTTASTTFESSSVSNPADNMTVSGATISRTTSTTSKSNPAASPSEDDLTDSVQGDSEDAFEEYFKYKLQYEQCHEEDWPDVESIRDYEQTGLHPVLLGDVLGDGRFRVVNKLGYGRSATVWLCHDNVSGKWRAVKVMKARASTTDCPDMNALRLFDGIKPDVLAANGIQMPLEHFWIEGPNGCHLCFVLPLLGPTLLSVASMYCHVPELIKDVCFRLVMALKFIHSQDLCHGDFRLENVLFRLVDGVDEWEEEALLELLGEPDRITVQHIEGTQVKWEPGVPPYLVTPTDVGYSAGVCSSQIAVIDFGVSYPVTQNPGDGRIPLPYASPEVFFNRADLFGFHSDIWALGVGLSKVRFDIEPFADDHFNTQLEALGRMERVMGPIPEPYRSLWKGWDGVFINSQKRDGEPRDDNSWKDESVMATVRTRDEESSREERAEECGHASAAHALNFGMRSELIMCITDEQVTDIANQAVADPGRMPGFGDMSDESGSTYKKQVKYYLPAAEVDQMFDLLMKIFRWHPQDRATIDQIANHKWFGDRNKQNQAATGTTKNDTNTGADTTAATANTDPDTDSAGQPASW